MLLLFVFHPPSPFGESSVSIQMPDLLSNTQKVNVSNGANSVPNGVIFEHG